jgi:hypothetical protein
MIVNFNCFGHDISSMPYQWSPLKKIMVLRHEQVESKMKLTAQQIDTLIDYLKTLDSRDLSRLQKLQKVLPKTTLELLFAIQSRGLDKNEAEKMAIYLKQMHNEYHIKNITAFDENTSHIIGREWQDIDYSGEGLTWEGQKAKYASYGITNFKTLDNLKKFFPVESKLPYFDQTYR